MFVSGSTLLILLVFSVAQTVLISCSPSEEALRERGRKLIGFSTQQMREKLGNPIRITDHRYGPMMGPGEQLSQSLQNGNPYQTWDFEYGEKHLLVFFRIDSKGEATSVLDVGIHVEGRVY
jgi:hypothetical protein